MFVILLTTIVTFGLCENLILSHYPVEMLGDWEVVSHEARDRPSLAGWNLEFHRNGTLIAKQGNVEYECFGTCDDERLRFIVAQVEYSGPIMKLSETEFVMEDQTGGTIKMQRPVFKAPKSR